MKLDYLIVGQGLAGTLLHYFLERAGKKVLVVDEYSMSSSRISSGIMNPLTGRRYLKSWMFDDLIDKAVPVYRALGSKLGLDLVRSLPIIRALPDREAEIKWDERSSLPEYEKYMGDEVEWGELDNKINKDVPFVHIKNGFHLQMPFLIDAYGKYLQRKDALITEKFEYDKLTIHKKGINWKGFKAGHIIFCEGPGATQNPFFDYLPFHLSKGEAMTVDVSFELKRVLKYKSFLVPWEKQRMWIGSANFWKFDDGKPTNDGGRRVIRQFDQIFKGQYDIHEHMAAVKPGVKDRRPLLGTHPKHNRLHIFNGLGTKGASLGPYFAEQMVEYLIKDDSIDKSVDIQRFKDKP